MTVTEAIPAHRDPAVVAATERALDELSARCPTLIVAVLLTDDGFEVSRTEGERDGDDDRLASMGSTLQALGEAVARELRLGDASHVVVAGARGSMLVRRVSTLPFALIGVFAPLREEDIRTSHEISLRLAATLDA